MKAMIMAAGAGTRLMPLTADIPKPMVPMMNVPLMENTVRLLVNQGFTDIIANLHHHPEVIKSYFGDGSRFGANMSYSPEDVLMGTAGGVKKCEWFLDETFVVVSGDALTDADLPALLDRHRRSSALATIALKIVEDVELFGIVVTAAGGLVQSFQEKPASSEARSNTANTGIYIFEPAIFKHIPPHQFYDFGQQVFPGLVQNGAPFYGFPIDQYWCDVGSLETYRQAHAAALEGQVKTRAEGKLVFEAPGASVFAGEGTVIGQDVRWSGTVVLGEGCRIEDGARIEDAVIWNNTVVGAGACIQGTVLGQNCIIGAGAQVLPGKALGSNSVVPGIVRQLEV